MRSDWKFIIDSSRTLEEAADYYHDQQFALADIALDKKSKTFSMDCWRVIYEEAVRTRDVVVWQDIAAPIVKTRLIFRDVDEMKIEGEGPDDLIDTIRYSSAKGEIRFDCCKGTKIRLKAKHLDGIITHIGEKIPKAFKYKTFLYWFEVSSGYRRQD